MVRMGGDPVDSKLYSHIYRTPRFYINFDIYRTPRLHHLRRARIHADKAPWQQRDGQPRETGEVGLGFVLLGCPVEFVNPLSIP